MRRRLHLVERLNLVPSPDLAAGRQSSRTTASSGSIGACARYGKSKRAVIVLAPEAKAAATSPCLRRRARAVSPSAAVFGQELDGAAFLGLALVPLDVERLAALDSRPRYLSATTATPRGTCTTSTDARHRLGLGGVEASPPWRRTAADAATTAVSMLGQAHVDVNCAVPLVFVLLSTRRAVSVPMSLKSLGSLSVTSAGTRHACRVGGELAEGRLCAWSRHGSRRPLRP